MKLYTQRSRRAGKALTLLLLLGLLLGVTGTGAAPNSVPADQVISAVTTPRAFFGYDIGQDYKLTPWQTHELPGEGVRKGIVEYAYELQRTSSRVRVFEYGQTEMGRPMIVTVVTSPANWARIEDLKGVLRKLADPRQVASDDEARQLSHIAKAVYWISPAIHSTERTSPEVGIRLGYHLASDDDAWTRNLLDNVIVVIEGSINPDGLDMVTDWYYQYKDTPYVSSGPPYYNYYVNHDNNRDFLAQGMAETRANTAARFEWTPTVYHDLHEAQNLLYMSPGPDPTNLAVNPLTVAEWLGYSGHTLTGLIAQGYTGAFTYDFSDNWYPGYNDAFSFMHNTMGIYYELRGALRATPLNIDNSYRPKPRAWYSPLPFTPGFTWHLMDAVNMEEDAIRQKLDYLAQNKDELLFNFYLKGKRNMEKAAGEAPYAFVIPAQGGDNADVTDLINNLRIIQQIEVDRLSADTTLGGRAFKAGDYVVRGNQPYGLTAKNFLATPPYPNLKVPYDVVSWDYGLMRDVEVVALTEPLPGGLSLLPVQGATPYAGALAGGVATQYVIEHGSNNNLAAALPQLWAAALEVAQADAAFTTGGRTFPAGTFIVTTDGSEAEHATLAMLADDLGLTVYAAGEPLSGTALRQPRVALYTPNNTSSATMPEGWVRMRLDATGFPYTRLYRADVSANALADYDVIVIPDMTTSGLLNGTTSSSVPPAYRGGITADGLANLKQWTEAGGVLVLLGRATRAPIERGWNIGVALGATSTLASAARLAAAPEESSVDDPELPDHGGLPPDMAAIAAGALYSPGSVVRIEVDATTKVGYGYDALEASWMDDASTPFFTTSSPEVAVVARYPAAEPVLLSGYMENSDVLHGKAAIVDAPLGAGRVVLLGPNTLYRAQATGTFMFFFNALLLGGRD